MHALSRRWRKPKCRPSKRNRLCAEKSRQRFIKENPDTSNEHLPDQNISEEKSDDLNNDIISTNEAVLTNISAATVQVLPSSSSSEEKAANISAAKLNVLPSTSASEEKATDKSSYVFMNNDMWATLLCNIKCEECNLHSLNVESKQSYGFATKIELFCQNCGKVYNSIFSSPRESESKRFEANKKLVEAFLKIGKGHAALEVFSMAIGIHCMDKKTFAKCLSALYEEKKCFKNDILELSRNIVRKKHQELYGFTDEQIIDIGVSYDGTWMKRGHTSLYGIGLVIDILTGLILDFQIMSKYCSECNAAKRDLGSKTVEFSIWFESHKPECAANFSGSSNAMEMKAAEILWKRSVDVCNMQYTTVLSDGDSKTFQHLLSLNVYGEDVKISKEECINHVAKRLGTGLRNKVAEWRGKGVTLGGKKEGSLKEDTILKLTNFYRKSIKDNVPDVQKMKSAVYASLFHTSSSDKLPKHNKCPVGSDSWCFYQRALANDEKPKSHKVMKTKISEDVLAKILPVYQRLASNSVLERCVSGKTQNMNESAHSVIWRNCSKETFVSQKRLELVVTSSVAEFNFGCLNSLSTEQEDLNSFSITIAKRRDKRRLNQIEKRSSAEWKKRKINKKISKSLKNKNSIAKEGETYSSGKF